jgi:hypothetical protein
LRVFLSPSFEGSSLKDATGGLIIVADLKVLSYINVK